MFFPVNMGLQLNTPTHVEVGIAFTILMFTDKQINLTRV